MFQVVSVTTTSELEQLLELQRQYLRGKTDDREEKQQGFLTVEHSLDLLIQMHELEPSIIVKEGNELAGYALVMDRACRDICPVLVPMFENFDELIYDGKLINDYSFYVMGQVCVDKRYRGQGVFDLLYQKHKENFQQGYDFVITEISTRNHRSLRAHARIGFKTIHVYTDDIDEWAITLWNWKS